jgi:hypothetical protein
MSGTPLVLLVSPECWEEFQGDISTKYRTTDREIAWTQSSAPTSYPCLVSAVWVETSVVCLFVYPKDVELLIEAAGGVVEIEGDDRVDEPWIVSRALPATSQEGLWNRHMVALMLTVVHELISVGVTKEDRFEKLLSTMLDVVEDKHAHDIEAVRQLVKDQFNSDDKGPQAE